MDHLIISPRKALPFIAEENDEKRWHQFRVQKYLMYTYSERWSRSTLIVSGEWTGKTRMMLNAIGAIWLRACIVVPNRTIAKWIVGTFKDYFDTAILTSKSTVLPEIAVVVHASFNIIWEKLSMNYPILFIDEAHKIPPKRRTQINCRKGKFIVWRTATPKRKEFYEEWFKMLFGELYNCWATSLPITVLKFEYSYNYSLEEYKTANEWLSPASPELYRRLYGNNQDRNKKLLYIISSLQKIWYKRIIIFTDRDNHIENIHKAIPLAIIISGKTNHKEFRDYVDSHEEYIIIGSHWCVGEWFDLPALEVWILFMSTSWNNTVRQTSGRARRFGEWKELSLYVDFVDKMTIMWSKPKVLWRSQRNKVYKENNRIVRDFTSYTLEKWQANLW